MKDFVPLKISKKYYNRIIGNIYTREMLNGCMTGGAGTGVPLAICGQKPWIVKWFGTLVQLSLLVNELQKDFGHCITSK